MAAYTLNEVAATVASLALTVVIYDRTGSALGSAAYFLCAMFGPSLVSPALTARLDQRPSRLVLVSLYGLEALVFAVVAWSVGQLGIAVLLTVALIDGIFAVTARALARAVTVGVIGRADLLREGNALTNASFSVCFMLAPALGGVAVALGGPRTALLASAAVFALIALMLAFTAGLPTAAGEHTATSEGRLRRAVRYARVHPLIRTLMLLQAAMMLAATVAIPVEIVLADRTLGGGAGGYGALLSGWGAGAVVGSLIYTRWRATTERKLLAFGIGCLGAGFTVLAVAPVLAVAVIGAGCAGVGNGIAIVAARTALQEAVPAGSMALMMSLNEVIYQAVPGLGILVGGALAAAAGPRAALATAGVSSLVVAFAAWRTLGPEVLPDRRAPERQPAVQAITSTSSNANDS